MVTLKDIAQKVGVSTTIVSLVLNQRPGRIRVSEAKREEILKTAAEMGYVPNRSARTLVTRNNRTVGLIVNHPRYHPLSLEARAEVFTILNALYNTAAQRNFRTLYTLADLRNTSVYEDPEFIRDRSVDGAVLFGYLHRPVAELLLKSGLPFAHIGTNMESNARIPNVYADMVQAAKELLDKAAAAGLHAVHLYLPQGPGPKEIGVEFLAYAQRRHPQLQATFTQSPTVQGGFEETITHGHQLSGRKLPPQLILTSISEYLPLTIGLRKGGLNIPEQTQVVAFSFDGYQSHRFGADGHLVSQIILPLHQTTAVAATLLLDRIEGRTETISSQALPCIGFDGDTAPSLVLSAKKNPVATPAP